MSRRRQQLTISIEIGCQMNTCVGPIHRHGHRIDRTRAYAPANRPCETCRLRPPVRPATRTAIDRLVPSTRNDTDTPGTGKRTTIFYDRDPVRVTTQWLSIGRHRYPINQLRRLRSGRGPVDRSARRCGYGAAFTLVTVAGLWPYLHPTPINWALAAAGVATAVAAAAGLTRNRRAHTLWADHETQPVLLYQTTNTVEFGKITRALTRACATTK
jgi:hypothetical protein